MTRPLALLALVGLVAAALLPAACLPIRDASPFVRGPREAPRLESVLPLDARGEAILRAKVLGFSEITTDEEWRGELQLTYPAWVDGVLSDVVVQAQVASGTVAGGVPLAAPAVRAFAGRAAQWPVVVEVTVRKEGAALRVARVSVVDTLSAEVPSVIGVLAEDAAGGGTYRGSASEEGAGAGSGRVRIEPTFSVHGISVRLRVPVLWDADTLLVTLAGERKPLADVLRAAPGTIASTPVEVRFAKRPDGLVAREVRQYRP